MCSLQFPTTAGQAAQVGRSAAVLQGLMAQDISVAAATEILQGARKPLHSGASPSAGPMGSGVALESLRTGTIWTLQMRYISRHTRASLRIHCSGSGIFKQGDVPQAVRTRGPLGETRDIRGGELAASQTKLLRDWRHT